MILQSEIIEIARANNVKTKTIDKDWILGHFLNAMYSIKEIHEKLVFKGGTCLKKCYIEDYRFSEDLDFTLVDKTFEIDVSLFKQIIKQAEKTSGAKFYFDRKKVQKFKDINQGYEVIVKFWGADHKPNQRSLPPSRWQTKIKIDISYLEELLTSPVRKSIFHNYSDKKSIDQYIPVYSLHEIISEKLRSLVQRNRPRDIYDIWVLSDYFSDEEFPTIKSLLQDKSTGKNINISEFSSFVNPEKERKNKRAWDSSLADHLPEDKLPDFNIVYEKVKLFTKKIINS